MFGRRDKWKEGKKGVRELKWMDFGLDDPLVERILGGKRLDNGF